MKNIKLTVFDMAGTTVNEDNVVYKTLQQALSKEGYNVSLDTVLEFGAGKEKYKAIEDILKSIGNVGDITKTAKTVFKLFKSSLKNAYQNLEVTPYEGVESLFKVLRANEITVVLNTGYDSETANTLLKKLNWEVGTTVDALITADDVKIGRPTSEMIDKAMEMFDISNPKQVLKAGDSIIDIEEGKNANCGITVGVLTGAHTRAQLQQANPSFILNSLSALEKILLK